jgi:hypothetical protein
MGKCVIPITVPEYATIPKSLCNSNPCQNSGSCILNSLKTNFICNCDDGFTGLIFKIIKL